MQCFWHMKNDSRQISNWALTHILGNSQESTMIQNWNIKSLNDLFFNHCVITQTWIVFNIIWCLNYIATYFCGDGLIKKTNCGHGLPHPQLPQKRKKFTFQNNYLNGIWIFPFEISFTTLNLLTRFRRYNLVEQPQVISLSYILR